VGGNSGLLFFCGKPTKIKVRGKKPCNSFVQGGEMGRRGSHRWGRLDNRSWAEQGGDDPCLSLYFKKENQGAK